MEKMCSLEVIQVVLVQCNLEDNKCQLKSEALYTFTPNKYITSNFGFLRTCNSDFDEIIITSGC